VEKKWTLLGHYEKQGRTSFFAMALAIYVAAETFGAHGHRYKILMCLLILISAAYLASKAIPSRSVVGISTVIFSLIWVLPIVNANVFYSVDLWFMLAHSILALAVAVGAFTYMKS
jgi:hypothetical protein